MIDTLVAVILSILAAFTVQPAPQPTPDTQTLTPELIEQCSTDDWYMDPVCVAIAERNGW